MYVLRAVPLKWKDGTAINYLEYLDNLERNKYETRISLQYGFLGDEKQSLGVDVFIHNPEEKDIPERNHVMHWIVKPQANFFNI